MSLQLIERVPFVLKPTSVPDIFEYGVAQLDGRWIYTLHFYKSFVVYALMLPTQTSAAEQAC
jgi:hypothetical protein